MLNRDQFDKLLSLWLSLGLLTLLTGYFWLQDRALYSKAFYLLFAFPALIALISARTEMLRHLRQPAVLLFLALALWVLASLGWAEGDEVSASLAKRPLYILLALAGMIYLSAVRPVISPRSIVIVSMIVVAAFIAWTAPGFIESSKPGTRYIGPGSLVHPLLTSHILGFLFVFGMAFILCAEKWDRMVLLCLLTTPVLLLGILLTGSRTPLVGIAAVLIWLCIIRPSRRTWSVVALMATLGALAYLIQPSIFTSRGVSWRPEIWSAAFGKIMEQPLIGHGFEGNIGFLVAKIKIVLRDPHNVMLAVALELGFVGLALWIAMNASALYASFIKRASIEVVTASCLLVFGLAAGLTEGGNFFSRPNESWFITWLPMGFVVAAIARQSSISRSAPG